MVTRKTWDEFRSTGLFWFTNTLLHAFGWALVVDVNENKEVIDAYPARVKFRGFDQDINTLGYQKVSEYIKENAEELLKEANE